MMKEVVVIRSKLKTLVISWEKLQIIHLINYTYQVQSSSTVIVSVLKEIHFVFMVIKDIFNEIYNTILRVVQELNGLHIRLFFPK